MKFKFLTLVLSLSLFLSACSQKTDLYFYENESWKIDEKIQYDEGLIDMFGQAISIAIGSEFGIPMVIPNASGAMDLMGIAFNLAKTEFRKQGIEFDWRKPGDTFLINVKGDTLEKFNRFSSGMAQVDALGNGQYHLYLDVLTLSELDPSLQEYASLMNAAFEYTFTLHAGHIFSSNADQQTGTKAIWYNPTEIDVVFSPIPPFSVGWALGGCGVLSGMISVSVAIMRMSLVPCLNCGRRMRKGLEICPSCGMYVFESHSVT
jgi:hypothetical protein